MRYGATAYNRTVWIQGCPIFKFALFEFEMFSHRY
jgi:hypothetical protein